MRGTSTSSGANSALAESSNTSVRLGLLDINADFDVPVTSGLFVGSPHGIGTEFSQTGGNGPSVWPVTGLGIRVAGALSESLRWRVGAFEGTPGDDDEASFAVFDVAPREGSLLIGELEYASDRVNKISLGLWSYTADFDRLDADQTTGPVVTGWQSRRVCAGRSAAGQLWCRQDRWFIARGRWPMRASMPSMNSPPRPWSSATRSTSRPDDAFGFGVAYGRTGDLYRAVQDFAGIPAASAETSFELTYLSPLTSWLALAPSVQFVHNPGADLANRDAWVVGLRFEISHEKSWPMFAQRNSKPAPSVARADE